MHPARQDSSQLDITIIKPSLLLIFVVDGTKIRGNAPKSAEITEL